MEKFGRVRSRITGSKGSVLNTFPSSRRAEIQWDDSVTVEIVNWIELDVIGDHE